MKGKGKAKGDVPKGGGEKKNPGKVSNTVFVGALPKDPNEASIRAYFEQFGEIAEIKMMEYDSGTSKGFCFITFAAQESAEAVFANYENNIVEDKWVDCKPADGGTVGPKPGDWTCPMCGDLVFAKRNACNM